MRQGIGLGINALESCANERVVAILSRFREGSTTPIRLVGSTRIDETSEMKSHRQKLSFLINNRADIWVVHAQYVDLPRRGDSMGGFKQFTDMIHAAGLLTGISTHRVETIELCERQNYGIDGAANDNPGTQTVSQYPTGATLPESAAGNRKEIEVTSNVVPFDRNIDQPRKPA